MKHCIILLAFAFATASAIAHPGKTDAKGWHTNKETGERHQHKKPEAKKAEAPKNTAPAKKPESPKKKK
jgi:hypothetical protein